MSISAIEITQDGRRKIKAHVSYNSITIDTIENKIIFYSDDIPVAFFNIGKIDKTRVNIDGVAGELKLT